MSSAVMMFRCCVMPQHSHQTTRTPTRPRIDRSMIGMPTNFQHTGHIGSSDVGGASSPQVDCAGMQTKGGYSETNAFPSHLKLVDLTEVKLS